jgi:hypothetical protein
MQLEEGAVLNGTVLMGDKKKTPAGTSSAAPSTPPSESGTRSPTAAPANR